MAEELLTRPNSTAAGTFPAMKWATVVTRIDFLFGATRASVGGVGHDGYIAL